MESPQLESILKFWFSPVNAKKWFDKDPVFDRQIFVLYNPLLIELRKVNFTLNSTLICNSLELIILFDQFSRNISRHLNDKSNRIIDDSIAIKLAYKVLEVNLETNFSNIKQEHFYFLILPLRHSLNDIHCKKAIEYIIKFESNNKIINEEEWFRFKLQSYRSLYNATSHIQESPDCTSYDVQIKEFIEYLDPACVKNITRLTQLSQILDSNIIIKTIYKSLQSRPLNSAYCISLSGGVDSMVIAHALQYLGSRLNFKVIAVHIEHSNREEGTKEAEMIKLYCDFLGIQFFHIKISHIKRHEIKRELYELETRIIRFDFYRNIKKHFNVEYFALGHHRGDLAENVLTNLLKGRTLLDLPVMTEFDEQESVILWRPLLSLPKSDILDYASEFGIPYTKNSTPEWSVRGKLRNHILPMLNSMFNCVEDNLCKAGEESKSLETHFDEIIEKIYSKVTFGKLGFYLNINELKSVPLSVWKQLFQKIMFKVNSKIIAEHVLLELKKLDNKIITVNKDYVSSFNGENLIFFDSRYFNFNYNSNRIVYEIKQNPSNDDVMFTLDGFISGKFSYTIRSNANVNANVNFNQDIYKEIIISKSLEKHAKQQINNVISGQILNKYSWIDMKCSQQKKIFHYIVTMEYQ